MEDDPEVLKRRRDAKIIRLTQRRLDLKEALETAVDAQKWTLQGLLVATERALKWQYARAGLLYAKSGKNTHKNTEHPLAGDSSSAA